MKLYFLPTDMFVYMLSIFDDDQRCGPIVV